MEILIGSVIAIVIAYLAVNGKRNSDPCYSVWLIAGAIALMAPAGILAAPPTQVPDVRIISLPADPKAVADHFRLYRFPKDGFEAQFPSKPLEYRTERGGEYGFVNSYQAVVVSPASQYSVFVNHSPKKVFEKDAIDAYLDGLVLGLVRGAQSQLKPKVKRREFLGFPAIEYSFTGVVEGNDVVFRGLAFIVDADHIRLSTLHLPDDPTGAGSFARFAASFRLIPIDAPLKPRGFVDAKREIAFATPYDWVRSGLSQYEVVVASFAHPGGHSFAVKDSGVPAYKCANYRAEISTSTEVRGNERLMLGERTVLVFRSQTVIPKHNVVLLVEHYCWDTDRGAVALECGAPASTFFRSQAIFRRVAASMQLRH